jgi:hypothetical protein
MSKELNYDDGLEEEIVVIDEEAADAATNQATIASKPTNISRSDLLAKMVSYASKMNIDTLAQAVETIGASPDDVYASTQQVIGDNSGKNKASVKSSMAGGDSMQAVKEDLALLFGDSTDLTEDFRLKVSTLFEAAVSTRVDIETARIEESFDEKLEESYEEIKTQMMENIDNYLNYAVAEWASDNKLSIENSVRTQMAESFLNGMKTLFEEHYVEIPDDKVDVVESMSSRIDELEKLVNETTADNIALSKIVNEKEVKEISDTLAEGLTSTQKDKFEKLIEAVDYSDATEFRKKANIIKETYFAHKNEVKVVQDQLLSESVEEPEKAPVVDSTMQMYVSSLSKTVKK